MKKPFLHALGAALYIAIIVSIVNFVGSFFKDQNESIIIPMTMLSLFVLSAAIMGFLFLSEPISLLIENRKKEAFVFFGKVVGLFTGFVILYAILILIL